MEFLPIVDAFKAARLFNRYRVETDCFNYLCIENLFIFGGCHFEPQG